MGISRILFLLIIVIVMAIFVVCEKNKIIEIGYQVAHLQRKYAELSEENRKLNYFVNRLKSPDVIVSMIQSKNVHIMPGEESAGIVMMGQKRYKDYMMRLTKASVNKELYSKNGQF